jgi:hypothetical protein
MKDGTIKTPHSAGSYHSPTMTTSMEKIISQATTKLDMFAVSSSAKIFLGDLTQKLAKGELKYDIFIFTDGGFDRETNSGSAGIYICDSKGNCLREFGRRFVPVFSSTQAERLAMKEGLLAVTELAAFAEASRVLLLCYSQVEFSKGDVSGVSDAWKKSLPETQFSINPLNEHPSQVQFQQGNLL